MTTKQMKEIYEANPDEWIALWSTAIGWMNHGKWCKSRNPAFIIENHYKLVHIKHKQALKAYLADNAVEIEYEFDEETYNNAGWYTEHNFIENYNPDLEYRLKEKEDVKTLSKQSSQSTSSELSDSSNTSDIGLPNIKSFTAHGFEVPDFEGEILKEIDEEFFGWARIQDKVYAVQWNDSGKGFLIGWDKRFDLTPIKQHWYDDPANFPAMLIRDTEERMGYIWVDNKEQFIKRHRQGFRLITKAERDRLFCKE